MIVHEIREIHKHKLQYFRSFSGVIDFIACVLSVCLVALYLMYILNIGELMKRYKRGDDVVAYFAYLLRLERALSSVFGFVIVVGMLKFLHLLRFNPLIWRFLMTLRYAAPALLCVLSVIVGAFVAFGSFMYVLAGGAVAQFSHVATSLSTLFEGILGIIYMDDLEQVDRFWGPGLYVVFLFVMTILVFNLLIIVLIHAMRYISTHPMPNEESEILWLLIYKCVQYLGIKRRTH